MLADYTGKILGNRVAERVRPEVWTFKLEVLLGISDNGADIESWYLTMRSGKIFGKNPRIEVCILFAIWNSRYMVNNCLMDFWSLFQFSMIRKGWSWRNLTFWGICCSCTGRWSNYMFKIYAVSHSIRCRMDEMYIRESVYLNWLFLVNISDIFYLIQECTFAVNEKFLEFSTVLYNNYMAI